MREDYASLPMNMHDDGFGEFDTPDLGRDDANPTIDVTMKPFSCLKLETILHGYGNLFFLFVFFS